MNDPWADLAAAKWDDTTTRLHDFAAHKHDRIGDHWPQCPRCSTLAVEFHDRHDIGHLVPADVRYQHERKRP